MRKPLAVWQREIDRETDPETKRFLQRCMADQIAEMRGKPKRKRDSKQAIAASIKWQSP